MVKTKLNRSGLLLRMVFGFAVGCATLLLAMVFFPKMGMAQKVVEVKLIASPDGKVYFDPIGIRVEPGDIVRWIQTSGYHSVTAYHPENDNHELRIPDNATPWDSGILMGQYPAPGSVFEHKFTAEGVYDYFCRPHEQAGMVGRIIVGRPLDGPGTQPFNYAPGRHWKPVPEVARKQFPSIEEILAKGIVRSPGAN